MRTFTVSEVALMLDVSEESVRRWIREGKLKAERRLGRNGNSIDLQDVVDLVNQPPHSYMAEMLVWLSQESIPYDVVLDQRIKSAEKNSSSAVVDMASGLVHTVANLRKKQRIILRESADGGNADAGTEEAVRPKVMEAPPVIDAAPQTEADEIEDLDREIRKSQLKIIKLRQEIMRLQAEISIVEADIEAYRLRQEI